MEGAFWEEERECGECGGGVRVEESGVGVGNVWVARFGVHDIRILSFCFCMLGWSFGWDKGIATVFAWARVYTLVVGLGTWN